MPKGSRHTVVKGATSSRGRKSRKKRQPVRHPAPSASKQISPISSQKGASSVRLTSSVQQIPQQPHVLPDLKRIGIIAGAMIVILVILYIVL